MKQKGSTNDVTRRDFLKLGGLAAASSAAALGTGTLAGCTVQEVQAAEVEVLYTCPIDGKHFSSYEAIQEHFTTNHPEAAIPEVMRFTLNGVEIPVQIEPHWTLQYTLQHALDLTGAKTMCDRGGCGSCTVLIDGKPALSCMTLAVECEGRQIETIEGIAADEKWQPLFNAFANHDGSQCGYCSPGQVVMAKFVIEKYGNPTDAQIVQEMGGNICRCGTYQRHPLAISEAIAAMGGGQ
jgi:xanthine dehydrogenase YagT iron-sulfur-binding subunit